MMTFWVGTWWVIADARADRARAPRAIIALIRIHAQWATCKESSYTPTDHDVRHHTAYRACPDSNEGGLSPEEWMRSKRLERV